MGGDRLPLGGYFAASGDPAMRPARPIHLLRPSHRHRRQAASHSLVPDTRPWATSIRLSQSGARHETLGDINPVGGGLLRAAIRR